MGYFVNVFKTDAFVFNLLFDFLLLTVNKLGGCELKKFIESLKLDLFSFFLPDKCFVSDFCRHFEIAQL